MAENSNIVEKELFGEVVKVDKNDGLPLRAFGHRKPSQNPADAPDIPEPEPKPKARVAARKPRKPPATLAQQLASETKAENLPADTIAL